MVVGLTTWPMTSKYASDDSWSYGRASEYSALSQLNALTPDSVTVTSPPSLAWTIQLPAVDYVRPSVAHPRGEKVCAYFDRPTC